MKQGTGENSIEQLPNGFILRQKASETEPQTQGDFAIFTDQPATITDCSWFRGGWWDSLTMVWKNVEEAGIINNPAIKSGSPEPHFLYPSNLRQGKKKPFASRWPGMFPIKNQSG